MDAHIYPSIHLSVRPSVSPSVSPPDHPSIHSSVHPLIHPSIRPFFYIHMHTYTCIQSDRKTDRQTGRQALLRMSRLTVAKYHSQLVSKGFCGGQSSFTAIHTSHSMSRTVLCQRANKQIESHKHTIFPVSTAKARVIKVKHDPRGAKLVVLRI